MTGPAYDEFAFATGTAQVWGACPRCKQVHEIDPKQHMQTCPYCEARWPREKNGK